MQGWRALGLYYPDTCKLPHGARSSPARAPSLTPQHYTTCRNGLKSTLCTESWRYDSYLFNLELNNSGSVNKKYLESFKKCQIKSEWTVIKADLTESWLEIEHPQNTGKKKAKTLLKFTTRWGVSIACKQTKIPQSSSLPTLQTFQGLWQNFLKEKKRCALATL